MLEEFKALERNLTELADGLSRFDVLVHETSFELEVTLIEDCSFKGCLFGLVRCVLRKAGILR